MAHSASTRLVVIESTPRSIRRRMVRAGVRGPRRDEHPVPVDPLHQLRTHEPEAVVEPARPHRVDQRRPRRGRAGPAQRDLGARVGGADPQHGDGARAVVDALARTALANGAHHLAHRLLGGSGQIDHQPVRAGRRQCLAQGRNPAAGHLPHLLVRTARPAGGRSTTAVSASRRAAARARRPGSAGRRSRPRPRPAPGPRRWRRGCSRGRGTGRRGGPRLSRCAWGHCREGRGRRPAGARHRQISGPATSPCSRRSRRRASPCPPGRGRTPRRRSSPGPPGPARPGPGGGRRRRTRC